MLPSIYIEFLTGCIGHIALYWRITDKQTDGKKFVEVKV